MADKVISGGPGGFTNNFRIYWDGDLLEEGLDGASSREGAARVFKADGSIVFTADGTANCNWTKNTPSATGDMLGDWREEIIVRTTDNKYVRVYTTNIKTNYRNYTLWHDHQYRQGMVWESMGYNQPPHASYFLGELEGITIAPPPLTMTGRKEISNGSSITAAHNNQHVIVCETNDTKITVAEGAKPYMVTFNVPSWVQGTNSNNTTGNPKINYTYYTCNVSGAAFTGSMRLVKQGDGILNLPKVDKTYTGETNIWAGTVNFDGTLLASPLWLNRFAELNSNGGQFRSIKMDYDAKLRPGRADHRGTITTDSLLLGFGSRVIFDLYCQDITADLLKTKYISIETKNWNYGPQYLSPVFEFVFHGSRRFRGQVSSSARSDQKSGRPGDIRIEGLGTNKKSSTRRTANSISISGHARCLHHYLDGQREQCLGHGHHRELHQCEATEDKDFFVTGDNVLFNDDAKQFTVNINGEIEADSVIVDNTKAYTFQGTVRWWATPRW